MSQISSYGHVYLNCSAELFPFRAENFDLRKRLAVLSSYFFPSKHERTSFFKTNLTKFTSKPSQSQKCQIWTLLKAAVSAAKCSTVHLTDYNISNALLPEVCDLENQPSTPTQEQWQLQGKFLSPCGPLSPLAWADQGLSSCRQWAYRPPLWQEEVWRKQTNKKWKLCQACKHRATVSNFRPCSFMDVFYYLILLDPSSPSLLLPSYHLQFLPSVSASHPSGWRIAQISFPSSTTNSLDTSEDQSRHLPWAQVWASCTPGSAFPWLA